MAAEALTVTKEDREFLQQYIVAPIKGELAALRAELKTYRDGQMDEATWRATIKTRLDEKVMETDRERLWIHARFTGLELKVDDVRGDLKRVVWMVLTAVLAAVLGLVLWPAPARGATLHESPALSAPAENGGGR